MSETFLLTAYAWTGWAVTTVVLLMLCFLTAQISRLLFKNLLKMYRLETIKYWLVQMEKNGTHICSREAQRALEEKRAQAEATK